ncbi:hypothetical protein V494_04578 [Pseudogymnoascus sp. VKM F-4513 (FW-928)]|nr:hypothetical protein V494_04578 [Pseudogymnoascus sp. VKM F-4513 (FW-928)]
MRRCPAESYLAYVSHDMMDPIVTCHTYPGGRPPSTLSQQRREFSIGPPTPYYNHALNPSSLYHDIATSIYAKPTSLKTSAATKPPPPNHSTEAHQHLQSKMAAKSLIPLLVAMMLITGCANTLFTKYQDNQCVSNCSDPNPSNRKHFEQPVIQTAQMFIGEMGCWLVVGLFSLYQRFFGDAVAAEDQGPDYHAIHEDEEEAAEADEESLRNPATRVLVKDSEGRLQLKGWKVAMLALPATCDILGTTLMNAGFLFVVASVYQMTRGMLVIWVGIFSVVFLKKKLYFFQWSALATVVLGVTLVGLAGSLQAEDVTKPASVLEGAKNAAVIISRVASTPDAISTMIGVFLIAGAQIFTATQFVLEEFILEKYALEPLRVVGWEGIFGFTFTALGMLVLHLAIGRTEEGRLGYFDAVEGLRQVFHNRQIAISSILIMISIGQNWILS